MAVTNNTGIDFDADLASIVSDLGDVLTWSGDDYACVVDPVGPGTKIETEAGYFVDVSFVTVVQTSLFSSARPVANNKVTINSVVYRVVRAETDEADSGIVLDLAEVTA